MTIRDATVDDLPAIVAIYNASIPGRLATADTEPIPVERRLDWFAAHAPDRRPLWVAEDDGTIAGWVSFSSFYEGRPAYNATAEISIYVASTHHRRGVGRTLLGEAVRRAPEFGVQTLLYFVFAHNAPSIGLCQGFGFAEWGMLPNIAVLDGERRSLAIYGLRVAAPSPPTIAMGTRGDGL